MKNSQPFSANKLRPLASIGLFTAILSIFMLLMFSSETVTPVHAGSTLTPTPPVSDPLPTDTPEPLPTNTPISATETPEPEPTATTQTTSGGGSQSPSPTPTTLPVDDIPDLGGGRPLSFSLFLLFLVVMFPALVLSVYAGRTAPKGN